MGGFRRWGRSADWGGSAPAWAPGTFVSNVWAGAGCREARENGRGKPHGALGTHRGEGRADLGALAAAAAAAGPVVVVVRVLGVLPRRPPRRRHAAPPPPPPFQCSMALKQQGHRWTYPVCSNELERWAAAALKPPSPPPHTLNMCPAAFCVQPLKVPLVSSPTWDPKELVRRRLDTAAARFGLSDGA